MTDLTKTIELLESNNISFNKTNLYNENNEKCGYALWLEVGHIEFDNNEVIFNVVNY